MNARLLSNVTMQPLVTYLRPWSVSVGTYDNLVRELVDEASEAAAPHTTHVLCIFDSDTLLGEALYDRAEPLAAQTFVAAVDQFCAAHPDKTVVCTTVCASTIRVANFAEVVSDAAVKQREAELNGALVDIARRRTNLLLVDIEPIFRRYGEERLTSAAFWYSGRIRYTSLMLDRLAAALHQALAAYEFRARKVLVLDLDDTLWGGILGEVGPAAIELSEAGRGAVFREFQRQLKALKAYGVLLAICSKNNPSDVDEVFATNPMMILARDDFAALRINWAAKPANLAEIAEALDVGIDSLVFIDDSPVERALVAQALPEVAVPKFPERIETLTHWFIDDVVKPYFAKYRVTSEDAQRTRQYQAREVRRSLATRLDLERFIADLDIVYTVHVDDPKTIVRASQMTQKTSQFNLTTRRFDSAAITSWAESPSHALIALEYADRFGSEGIVGLAQLDLAARTIVNLLMSCRVIGRNVERRLLQAALEVARAHGLASIGGEYIPSGKNSLVTTFYDTHGFALVAQWPDGRKLYDLELR